MLYESNYEFLSGMQSVIIIFRVVGEFLHTAQNFLVLFFLLC